MNTEETGRNTPERADKTSERDRNKGTAEDDHHKIKGRTTKGMKLGICIYLIVLVAAAYLIGGYAYREQEVQINPEHRIYAIFQNKESQKLAEQVAKNDRVVLIGDSKDGLNRFIDYVSAEQIKQGFIVRRRNYSPDTELVDEPMPMLSAGYNWVRRKVFGSKEGPVLWHIHSTEALDSQNLGKIGAFADAHPGHRFIISTTEAKPKSEFGFKKLKYSRPDDKMIIKLLQDKKVAKIVSKNIFKYHNNSVEFMSDLLHYDNPQEVFNQYFSEQVQRINALTSNCSKAAKVLSQLCEQGKFKSKEIKGLCQYNGAVAYEDGAYYWTSLQHIYGYSNINNKLCKLDVKLVEAPVPPEPVEVVQEKVQEVKETAKEKGKGKEKEKGKKKKAK